MDSPPYFALISLSFSPHSSNASSSVMRTQPGSSSPLGFVRFTGKRNRSGWYSACTDDCDFEQQCPRLCGADSSPSTLMTFPSCTVTQTPHSTLPQARQHERMRLTSPAVALTVSPSACIGSATVASDAAAPVTAIVFMKLRRVSVS